MYKFGGPLAVAIISAALAACGSDSTTSSVATSTARGTLAVDPPVRIASLDAATLKADLSATTSGAQLLEVTGDPTCGVDFYYIKFWTVGGANESTESSGALMVPTGPAGTCSGARPIVLYAHGTQTNKLANIADITDATNSEGALVAAMFAAQGYIVVAPNYAGYDISTLGYHPYLNATQQSDEMIDILAAARTALPKTFAASTTDSGKLLLTGYSQGGYVALATLRAMEAAGTTVTAAAPMSGPYALEAFGDAVFYGNVNLGSTIFSPMLTTSYQHEYNNIYTATTDVYSSTYATGIDTLLPSTTSISTLYSTGKLPELALFNSDVPNSTTYPTVPAPILAAMAVPTASTPETTLFAMGFGTSYLINNNFRVSYVVDAAGNPDGWIPSLASPALAATAPTQTLRKAFYENDLRNGSWAPTAPTLLCGGENDPTVFFPVNTGAMAEFWSGLPTGVLTVLDVDPSTSPSGSYAAIQTAFQTTEATELGYLQTAAGGGLTLSQAEETMAENYHGSVAPFCALAARSFFTVVLSQ